jgi:hypothetical protein
MVFIEYTNEGIAFFLGFGRAMQYPFKFQIYVMEPKGFFEYLKRGIVNALSSYGHEQYPSDNLHQNNSTHGVYRIPNEDIAFLILGLNFKFLGVKKGFFSLSAILEYFI